MTLRFIVEDSCPKCRVPINIAVVELHPELSETAVHILKCSFCGFEKKKIFSIRAQLPKSAPAA